MDFLRRFIDEVILTVFLERLCSFMLGALTLALVILLAGCATAAPMKEAQEVLPAGTVVARHVSLPCVHPAVIAHLEAPTTWRAAAVFIPTPAGVRVRPACWRVEPGGRRLQVQMDGPNDGFYITPAEEPAATI